MEDRRLRCSRRKFLASAAALTLSSGLPPAANADTPASAATFRARPPKPTKDNRKPIATICTVYRPLSHAYHIAGRFIHGYPRDGRFHVPAHYVSSLYVDQTPDNDLSRDVARDHGIRLTRSIAEALRYIWRRLWVTCPQNGREPPSKENSSTKAL